MVGKTNGEPARVAPVAGAIGPQAAGRTAQRVAGEAWWGGADRGYDLVTCPSFAGIRRRTNGSSSRRAGPSGRSALVTPTGRVIAGDADGWTGADRLALPAEGGELVLPSGAAAFAEPVGNDEALILRPLQVAATSRPISDVRASADYRAAMAAVIGRRSIEGAIARASLAVVSGLRHRPDQLPRRAGARRTLCQ